MAGAGGAAEGRPEPPPEDVVELANGTKIPLVGFGTAFFNASGSELFGALRQPELACEAVTTAIRLGFRHIDTGAMYGNERHIGEILGRELAEGRLKREDFWITTKVAHPPNPSAFGLFDPSWGESAYMVDPGSDSGEGLLRQFEKSLERLGLGYVDLLLVHWPGAYGDRDASVQKRKRREMWGAMERIYEYKMARAIGVSNFAQKHLEELLEYCRVKPMMNQIETHPFLSQRKLQEFCAKHSIRLTAYCPLASGKLDLLKDPVLARLAQAKGCEVSQLVLRWLAQRGIVVIPKSTSQRRQRENLRVMAMCPELSVSEMAEIDALNREAHVCEDPQLIA